MGNLCYINRLENVYINLLFFFFFLTTDEITARLMGKSAHNAHTLTTKG